MSLEAEFLEGEPKYFFYSTTELITFIAEELCNIALQNNIPIQEIHITRLKELVKDNQEWQQKVGVILYILRSEKGEEKDGHLNILLGKLVDDLNTLL